MKKIGKTSPWMGFVAFAVCIVMYFSVALFLPPSLGLYLTAILEVGLLILSLICAGLSRVPLREIFPIKKPSWNHLLGVLVLYFASNHLVSIITYVTAVLFPEGMLSTINYMTDVTQSVPALIAFLIMTIMPAICEESLHRGFIMHSFSRIKSTAWRLILIGILFGVFHLDPYRFLITGALGVLLAYLMFETDNLLIPALFHFINNTVSYISTYTVPTTAIDASMFSPFSLGIVLCMYGVIGPFLLYGGVRVLTLKNCRTSEKPFPHKKFLIFASVFAAVSLITGLILIIANASDFFYEFMNFPTNFDALQIFCR